MRKVNEQTQDMVYETRLQVLRNGFSPLPNRDKRCLLEGWPTVEIDEAAIKKWSRMADFRATGLRLDSGLAVLDLDLDIGRKNFDTVVNAVLDFAPELEGALMRTGSGVKEAWFFRTDEPFGRIATPRLGEPDGKTYVAEVFGGDTPRQFGAFGAHTLAEDGETAEIEYTWIRDFSPATVELADLPLLTKERVFQIVDRITEVMISLGYGVQSDEFAGETDTTDLYDIPEDAEFISLQHGGPLTLDELRDCAPCNVAMGWTGDKAAKNPRRGLVTCSDRGVAIHDTMTGITHREESAEQPATEDVARAVADSMRELREEAGLPAPENTPPSNIAEQRLAELQEEFYFLASRGVFIRWTDQDPEPAGITLATMKVLENKNCAVGQSGPRGGRPTRISPVDLFFERPGSTIAARVEARFDRPRPTFIAEDGALVVNNVSLPEHTDTSGTVEPWHEFLEYLLPFESERAWFTRWLAYKTQHPTARGPAVVMVADNVYGTGRGTLFRVLRYLFGHRRVRAVDFEGFIGTDGQSRYNEWAEGSLFVTVDEGMVDVHNITTARRAYEVIKSRCAPEPQWMQIVKKRIQNSMTLAVYSTIIATNHVDAITVPDGDRRVAVLTNGDPAPAEFWERFNEWMTDPANIGALWEHLRTFDTGTYKPNVMPPKTVGKERALVEGQSDLFEALDEVLGLLKRNDYVTAEAMRLHLLRIAPELKDKARLALIKQFLKVRGYRMLYKFEELSGTPGAKPVRIKPAGSERQHNVFFLPHRADYGKLPDGARHDLKNEWEAAHKRNGYKSV